MSLELGINTMIKEMKKIHPSTYFALFVIILVNLYGIYSSALGKIISLFALIYIVLNENVKLALISFFIILLLNNKNNKEGFENKNEENSNKENAKDDSSVNDKEDIDNKKESKIPTEESSESKESTEINDPVASFKKLHCKNSKLMKNGVEINIADLNSVFPQLKFNLENEKCNPCEDNCQFKITSGTERITVEERLRPTSSTAVSTE